MAQGPAGRVTRGLAALACAALACAPALAAAPESADRRARPGRDAASLLAALRSAELVAVARVESVREPGAARLRLEEVWAGGGAPGDALHLREPSGGCGGLPLSRGETALLLLERDGAGWSCDPGRLAAHVPLEAGDLEPARTLVEGVIAHREDREALAAHLRTHLDVPVPRLREAVWHDVLPLLDAADAPFWVDRAADAGRSVEARRHALAALARMATEGTDAPLPETVTALASPPTPEPVRAAVLQLVGARRSAADRTLVERALADPSAAVRRAAVENVRLDAWAPLLVRQLAGEADPGVRLAVVRQLGALATPEAVDALARLAEGSEDAVLRREAERWLAAAREASARRETR